MAGTLRSAENVLTLAEEMREHTAEDEADVFPVVRSFEAGGVRLEGVTPCGRCVVPQRDPDTGEPTPSFRETFLERREATFPDWADEDAFDHFYSLMIVTNVPPDDRGRTIRRGDAVTVPA